MKFDLQSLLKDKNVLYITLFIAISNMFAYLMFRQFDAIIFFVIIALFASYFSKNMIIIMLAAILSTNLAISIKMIGKVKEGFDKMKKKEGMGMPAAKPTKPKTQIMKPGKTSKAVPMGAANGASGPRRASTRAARCQIPPGRNLRRLVLT